MLSVRANVLRRTVILGLLVLLRVSSCAVIYDGFDEEQQIHEGNDENNELTVVQAGFSQLETELNDNASSMPSFPVSIASDEIDSNKLEPITIASPMTAFEKVELAQSVHA